MEGMGLISWVVFGALAGWLARLIMPGKDPGGCFVTPLIGIVGAVLGGFLATLLGFGGIARFYLPSLLVAILGALIVLFIYRKIKG